MHIDLVDAIEQTKKPKDRRKSPRSFMDLPIEYRVRDVSHPHGGVVVNGSETGLLIHSVRDIQVGTKLNISVLFPAGFELTDFEVFAEIVRKEVCWEENWQGFEYGLTFIQIKEGDARKLAQLLKKRSRLK